MKTRAFTFIEVLIVTVMVAILSVGLTLSFSGIREKTAFDQSQTQIVEIIQKARGLSLSNRLIDGSPILFYEVNIRKNVVRLFVRTGFSNEMLEEYFLDTNFDFEIYDPVNPIGDVQKIYYFPPFGDVCFNTDCNSGLRSKTIRLHSDKSPERDVEITVDVYGGFPEVNESPAPL